jgi:arylsulfatase
VKGEGILADTMHKRPNILVIITDQQRADHLGCYGNPDLNTPHIDALAACGTRFTRAFVSNPLCMPTRATLFTGMYPKAHGVRENGIALSQDLPLLPELLRQNGYRTASIGKLHLVPYSIKRTRPASPDEIYETPEYWAEHNDMPVPYYGFESVYLTAGHGPYTFGHYRHEIGAEAHRLLDIGHALRPPTGVRESWKSAIPAELHYNTVIADKTIAWLEARAKDSPFFLWCSFPDPHHPYMPPAPYCDQYDPASVTFNPARRVGELDDLPAYFRASHEGRLTTGGLEGGAQISDHDYREIFAHTYGMISMIDDQVGRIMAALDRLGLRDETIVVFMSDHADLLGDHWLINKGPFLYESLMRVPMIWCVPGAVQGAVEHRFVSAVDFSPTLLDAAGIPLPEGVQGQSYLPGLMRTGAAGRHRLYIEYDCSYLPDRLRHLRTDDWAITFYASGRHGLLFNLKDDPRELVNRWGDPHVQGVKHDLLLGLLEETVAHDSWLPAKKGHA